MYGKRVSLCVWGVLFFIMSKDTFYFSHDYNARQDEKIKRLIRKHGLMGYGIFWAIVEDLYNNTNVLRLDYEGIAFELHTEPEVVKSVINDFDLFCIDGDIFGSESIEKRLQERAKKSRKAADSVNIRWAEYRERKLREQGGDTNVLQTNNERNTKKERKGKDIKGNESKENIDERKLKFATNLKPFLPTYGKDLLNNFYNYWTEQNKSQTKMRFELEKTWDLSLRLKTWARNDKNFKPTQVGTVIEPKRLTDAEKWAKFQAEIKAREQADIDAFNRYNKPNQ